MLCNATFVLETLMPELYCCVAEVQASGLAAKEDPCNQAATHQAPGACLACTNLSSLRSQGGHGGINKPGSTFCDKCQQHTDLVR